MRIVYDTESDGFLNEATKVWCLCLKTEEGESRTYHDSEEFQSDCDGSIHSGLLELSAATELVCQNQLGHDLPLLKKLYNWEPNEHTKITDTLVLSFLYNPDRKAPVSAPSSCGPHGLEGWGYRVGRGKVSHEDWSVLSADMLRRCYEDVAINEITYHALETEARGNDWSHAVDIEHKVRVIVNEQERVGVKFDKPLALSLIEKLEDDINTVDTTLGTDLPANCKPWGVVVSRPFISSGGHSKMVRDWASDSDWDYNCVAGPFTRITWEPMNLGSMKQVKEYLLTKTGWQPTEWNYKDGNRTSPKITEDSFESIGGDIGQCIKNRYLWSHRKSQIQGWVNRLRPDGRLTASAVTCGTNTRRLRHINVANVPKAKDSVYLGKEMRSLFMASEGNMMVGHDAAGLELRMLAHYMNDPDFTKAVIHGSEDEGTDIHTLNQQLAGLPSRDSAKTFIYAFLYGAGDEKIGRIVGGTAADGAALKRRFLRNLPALAKLIKRVKRASKKGWLRGIDGSKIWMRRNDSGEVMSHKALNTLLQSAGAIVMKESMVILDESRKIYCPKTKKVIDMHDEAQADVPPEEVEKYMELAEDSVVQAGVRLKLRVSLAATAKVGLNWSETH